MTTKKTKRKSQQTITILGVKLPVSEKVFYPKDSETVKAYIDAIKKGKGTAKRNLKS